MFCECEKKCQNILMSRAQTSGTIFMIFLYIAQNFDSIIGAKFQDPNFKDKGVIKVQSKSGAVHRGSRIALRASQIAHRGSRIARSEILTYRRSLRSLKKY